MPLLEELRSRLVRLPNKKTYRGGKHKSVMFIIPKEALGSPVELELYKIAGVGNENILILRAPKIEESHAQ